jgi:hypothetical protein
VPNLDDERMENYLKQFRPMAAEPLPPPMVRRFARRPVILAAWAFAAAVLVAVALILAYRARRPAPTPQVVKTSAPAGQAAASPALTLRNANELLAHAPSYGAALDGIAFRRESAGPPPNMKSALEVLGREDRKL